MPELFGPNEPRNNCSVLSIDFYESGKSEKGSVSTCLMAKMNPIFLDFFAYQQSQHVAFLSKYTVTTGPTYERTVNKKNVSYYVCM